MNATAPTPVPLHVCFSGALACSGCNPCPECKEVVRTIVLPAAIAPSINVLSQALYDILAALEARGVTPQSLGLNLPPEVLAPAALVQTFYGGYAAGWSGLHGRMQSGDLAGKFAVQPAGAPPGGEGEASGEAPVASAGVDREARTAAPPAEAEAPATAARAAPAPKVAGPRPLEALEIARMVAVPATGEMVEQIARERERESGPKGAMG
jgi:hypothetical protein